MRTRSQGINELDELENLTYLSGVIKDVEQDEDFDKDGEELGNNCLRAEALEEENGAQTEENFLSGICGIPSELVTLGGNAGVHQPGGSEASQSSQLSQPSQETNEPESFHTIHIDKLNDHNHKVSVENGSDDSFKFTLLGRETGNLVKRMSMHPALNDAYSTVGKDGKKPIKIITPGEVAYQFLYPLLEQMKLYANYERQHPRSQNHSSRKRKRASRGSQYEDASDASMNKSDAKLIHEYVAVTLRMGILGTSTSEYCDPQFSDIYANNNVLPVETISDLNKEFNRTKNPFEPLSLGSSSFANPAGFGNVYFEELEKKLSAHLRDLGYSQGSLVVIDDDKMRNRSHALKEDLGLSFSK